MHNANVIKNSLPINNESFDIENLVNQVSAKADLMEHVLKALIPVTHPHARINDPLFLALQNPAVYYSLNYLFETPLEHYKNFRTAFSLLPFDDVTRFGDIIQAFLQLEEALLEAHLNSGKNN